MYVLISEFQQTRHCHASFMQRKAISATTAKLHHCNTFLLCEGRQSRPPSLSFCTSIASWIPSFMLRLFDLRWYQCWRNTSLSPSSLIMNLLHQPDRSAVVSPRRSTGDLHAAPLRTDSNKRPQYYPIKTNPLTGNTIAKAKTNPLTENTIIKAKTNLLTGNTIAWANKTNQSFDRREVFYIPNIRENSFSLWKMRVCQQRRKERKFSR